MRDLTKEEVKVVDGAWLGLVVAAARLGWAVYRHHKLASMATWAARGSAIAGGTYKLAGALDPHHN